MQELDYSVLCRWFVGPSLDDAVWSPTTFSKNRDRLLAHDVAGVRRRGGRGGAGQLSGEHFTVDSTQFEAWTSLKSFQPRDTPPPRLTSPHF